MGGVWSKNQFMEKLARRTPTTLQEFMDHVDNFINAKDRLCALTEPRKKRLERADKKRKDLAKGQARKNVERRPHDGMREDAPSKGLGLWLD